MCFEVSDVQCAIPKYVTIGLEVEELDFSLLFITM